MSKGWLKAIAETPSLRDRITIVGLNDINADAARRLAAEFGLGKAAAVTSLEVRWPDGTTTTLADVKANQILEVQQ